MATPRYAQDTKVSAEKSRAEIETVLTRYGAEEFGYVSRRDAAYVTFTANNRKLVFHLPLPDRNGQEFTCFRRVAHGVLQQRSADVAYKLWEQACRQRWRALILAIKAKLEAVECGISTFEHEFMAHIVLPNGQTVGQWLSPQLELIYTLGRMPQPMLPAGDAEPGGEVPNA
jgi:hypothetical protein